MFAFQGYPSKNSRSAKWQDRLFALQQFQAAHDRSGSIATDRFTAFPTATPIGVRGYELRGIIRPGSEREFNDVHVLAIALVCRVSPRMQERLKADAGRNPPLCGSRQGYWAAWREALALGKHGARRQSRALAVCRGRA
jgi:hypothetical protein